jgi:hypothetical protein
MNNRNIRKTHMKFILLVLSTLLLCGLFIAAVARPTPEIVKEWDLR